MNLPESTDSALHGFHPAVSAWFRSTFPSVTSAQAEAWPLIRQRQSTLIAAPTGSGKTLRIVCRDGLPAAVMVAGKQQVLLEVDQVAVQNKLIKRP